MPRVLVREGLSVSEDTCLDVKKLGRIKLWKGMVGCGNMRKHTANLRELTRIAFSLRSGTLLRLIAYAGIVPSLEKCWGKTRLRVFLLF